jgi:hypothetical protein
MAHWRLKIAAAQFALGVACAEDLINAADQALNDGVYSQSLGELYSFRNPTRSDCFPLFLAAMREIQIKIPDHYTSIITLVEYHLIRLAEGAANERDTLIELYSINREVTWDPLRKVYSEALEQLSPFISYYYELDDYYDYQSHRVENDLQPMDQTQLMHLKSEIMTSAVNWLGRVDKVWEAMGFWATATGS